MENKRIASGYDVELQLKPEKFLEIIKLFVKGEVIAKKIKEQYEFDILLDDNNISVTSEENEPIILYPILEPITDVLRISLNHVIEGSNIIIQPTFMSTNINGLQYPFTLDGVRFPLSAEIMPEIDLKYVSGEEDFLDAIVLLANVDFAKLLKQEIDIPQKERKIQEAKSFLPLNADYAFGINKSIFQSIEELVRSKIKEDPAMTVSEIQQNIENSSIKYIVKGTYDHKSTTDALDPNLTIPIVFNFITTKDGFLQINFEIKINQDYKFLYTLLGYVIGILCPPFGNIIGGASADTIAKVISKKEREEYEQEIRSDLVTPDDYHYYDKNGVVKLRRQEGVINTLNCFLREPIKLSEQEAKSILYQQWDAIKLQVSDTLFNNDGISMWGILPILTQYVCNDVILSKVKYFKDGRQPLLVYTNANGKEEDIDINTAVQYIKDTERPDKGKTDNPQNTDNVRSAYGQLPQNFLSFPVAVHKENNEIVAFEFDNGLIIRKKELIKLYINRIVMIKSITLASRKSKKYFTTLRDDIASNNLSSLPPIDKQKLDSIYYED